MVIVPPPKKEGYSCEMFILRRAAARGCLRVLAAEFGWVRSGLLAAVSRIAAIQPNDLDLTNMNGPELPLSQAAASVGLGT